MFADSLQPGQWYPERLSLPGARSRARALRRSLAHAPHRLWQWVQLGACLERLGERTSASMAWDEALHQAERAEAWGAAEAIVVLMGHQAPLKARQIVLRLSPAWPHERALALQEAIARL